MHPVGPRSSGVYWVRRTLVAVVAVVVVAGVVWFVINRGNGPGVDPASENSAGTGTSHMTGVLGTGTRSSLPPVSSSGASSSGPGTSTGSTDGSTATTATSTGAKATGSTKATGTEGAKGTKGRKGGKGKHRGGAKSTAKGAKSTATGKATTTGTTKGSTTGTGKATGTATGRATAATTGRATGATKAPITKATPTTTAPPKPSYDAQGRLLCPDSAITIKATTGEPSYPVGSQPILGMTVTNTGSKSCVRDLSGPLQVYTVYTKSGTRIWSTSDCFPGQGSDIRELAPDQTVPYNIKWSGTTSSPGCAAPRTPVTAGNYTLVAHLGDLKSAPRPFTITG